MPTTRELLKINEALKIHDLAPLKAAILAFARNGNFKAFASTAGLRRESLYRTLQSDTSMRTDALFSLLENMGLTLQVTATKKAAARGRASRRANSAD